MTGDEGKPIMGPTGMGTLTRDEFADGDRSPEATATLKRLGPELISRLFTTSKTIKMYDMNNRATQRALGEFNEILAEIFAHEERAEIKVVCGVFLLNDCRITADKRHHDTFEYIAEEMRKKELEGIEFVAGITAKDLGNFLKMFFDLEPKEGVYGELADRLNEESISTVVLTRWVEREERLVETEESSVKIREDSNRVYFRTVALMGDILRTIEEKHILNVRKAKRLTQQMVDIIQTDESLLVGLASIKNFDEYTFMHSVNVSILSMVVAERLQLEKADVARAGVCGLFHDIGKMYVPSSILTSSGALSGKEWMLMKYHTIFGVKELSRINSLRDAIDSMFAALQHHIHFDMNGYPRRPDGWNLQLFSRIVTVADYYDAMTAYRTYQKEPVTPDKALRFILEKSGKVFDPFISKIFIQVMGLYPVGTILELDTGETAVVVRQNKDPRYIHRPQVILVDEGASPSAEPETVDLTERSSGQYCFKRSVVRTIHDSQIDVDKRVHFMT